MSEENTEGSGTEDPVSILGKTFQNINDVPEAFRQHFKPAPFDPNKEGSTIYTFNGMVPISAVEGLKKSVQSIRTERDDYKKAIQSFKSKEEDSQRKPQEDPLADIRAGYEAVLGKKDKELTEAMKKIQDYEVSLTQRTIADYVKTFIQKTNPDPHAMDLMVQRAASDFKMTEDGKFVMKSGYGGIDDWIIAEQEKHPFFWGSTQGAGAKGSLAAGSLGNIKLTRADASDSHKYEKALAEAQKRGVRVIVE